jgi:hypothetical protein
LREIQREALRRSPPPYDDDGPRIRGEHVSRPITLPRVRFSNAICWSSVDGVRRA